MHSALLDYRKYFYKKPVNFSFRLLHYARYGKDENKLYPMYAGDYYFVRGYTYNSFESTSSGFSGSQISPTNLLGSKLGVANAEIRLPLSGPQRLTLFKSKYLYTTLIGFFDGGVALYDYDNFEFSWEPKANKRTPIFSTGLALRVNLFGYLVLEPYIAKPFQRVDKNYTYGILIRGFGW
jgi:hypothetical protein